jgi:predicted DNA-binding transcriptional regulator YafY
MAKQPTKRPPRDRQLKTSDAERRVGQASRLGRILRVLELIGGRGRIDAQGIAQELECGVRTVYRDLQVLTLAGIPWVFEKENRSYRIREGGWRFPVLHLAEDELFGQAAATIVAGAAGLKIGAGAKPATTKLMAARISDESKRVLRDAEQLVSVLNLKLADHSRSQEVVKTIQQALLGRRRVAASYSSPYKRGPVQLTLHPYRLCLAQQAWYLIARPTNEESPKTYRVARFQSMRMLEQIAAIPEDFDLKAYFGNAWSIYRGAESYDVELLFSPDAAPLVTETVWHGTQQVTRRKDGSATVCFKVDGLEEIVWWILGWTGRVEVIKPEKLRTMVVEKLKTALQMNQPS